MNVAMLCCHVRRELGGLRSEVAKRIVKAASRCPSGVAACVILSSFAAEHRKSYGGMAARRSRL